MSSGRRYIVMGAGAVGATIGGMLQLAGERAVFIARGTHLEALQRDGLTLSTPSRVWRFRVDAVAHASDVSYYPSDVVLLATKSQDTHAALGALSLCAPRGTPVICAQNGVGNEDLAARHFDRVYGLVVFAPLGFLRPGHITIHSEPVLGGLDLGCHPTGVDPLAAAVGRNLASCGFDARAEPRILRWKYGKLLTNLGNVLQALAGPAALEGRWVEQAQAEAVACYRASAIEFASAEEVYRRFRDIRELPVDGSMRGGGSSWQSLARHTGSIETDFLNGEIVRMGERTGVPTPLNRALTHLARRAVAEGWPPGRLSAMELASQLGSLGVPEPTAEKRVP